MAFRISLRRKVATPLLAGFLLLTLLLFSLLINRLIVDSFQSQIRANRQFFQDQSRRELRAHMTIFENRILQMFSEGTIPLNSLARSGLLGDQLGATVHSKEQRESLARLLRNIQSDTGLSLITVVDSDGKVLVRATNPAAFGDDVLMREYVNPNGRVSSVGKLLQGALKGQTISTFEVFPPETLALENVVEDGKIVSSLKDHVSIPIRRLNVPTGATETRALMLTFAAPVLNSRGKTVAGVIAGRAVNKDVSIVQDIRNLLQDHATIFLGQIRVATTSSTQPVGESDIGTYYPDPVLASGVYNERRIPRLVDGDEVMGAFDPIKDFEGVILGALYIGRPFSYANKIAKVLQDIQNEMERKRTLYVITLGGVSIILGIVLWRDMQREIRLSNLRSQFVSSVSHELKTPLTAIRMFAEALQMRRGCDLRIQEEYLDTIVSESDRLTRLLNNVLDFSRIDRGQKTYDLQPISLADVANQVLRTMHYTLADQGFKLSLHIANDLPKINADADAVEQLILNLLTNAMKYSGKNREIDLHMVGESGTVLIEVSDRGIGIPRKEQRRIFEKFYRVPTPENRAISGTGIGLALVSHIAEAHGGTVELRSAPGEGSTFTVRLPIEVPKASGTGKGRLASSFFGRREKRGVKT